MSDESTNQEKEIFFRALEIEAGPEREAHLAAVCGGNDALREAVEVDPRKSGDIPSTKGAL